MNLFPQHYPVTSHTDHVGPGSTFVAIEGYKERGAEYIQKALEKGATRIVLERTTQLTDVQESLIKSSGAEILIVDCARKALASLSAEAWGYPSRSLKIIGITGTKGKTTTSYLLEHILRTAGKKTALLGTVVNRIGTQEYAASLTTPQPDYLHMFLRECVNQGVEYVVIEAAAQAFSVHRLDTLEFDAIVFTNFSLEHSEFYASQEDYFAAKCKIFDAVHPHGLIVLNADDERVSECAPQWSVKETVSMKGAGSYTGILRESTLTTLRVEVKEPSENYVLTSSNLVGEFSAYNILCCLPIIKRYGISPELVQRALDTFSGVPGRLCSYALPNKAVALIDNAHTPSSFEALFKAVRPLSSHVIVLFGAGGDRDALKRPLMGALAVQYADLVILTMDNPRSEDVSAIIDDILEGISQEMRHKVEIQYDREKAIRLAYSRSSEGSVLLLLGKGPVEYQHIKDAKIPFSEASILRTLRS